MTQPQPCSARAGKALLRLGLFAASIASLAAQQTTSNSTDQATSAASETPVMMSSFQVNSTENKGYITKNSATAFKTDESLIQIPQAVMVVTRDMITDTGYNQSSDVLAFAGVADFFRGESFELRGVRIGYDLIDEMPSISAYMDNIFVDSYEVIRGPAAVFYPTSQLGGIVLETTRKPLDYEQNVVSLSVNQWGWRRLELDTTGPIMKLGTGVFAYRVEGAYQGGKTYYQYVADDSKSIDPSLQWTNSTTRILVAADMQERYSVPFGAALLNPDGTVWDPVGRKLEAGMPSGGNEMYRYSMLRMQFQHTIGTNWEMKSYVMLSENNFRGPYVYNAGINFVTGQSSWGEANEHGRYRAYDTLSDFTGKYDLFGIPNRSTFGYTAAKIDNRYPNLVPYPGVVTNWNNISFNTPMQSVVTPVPTNAQNYMSGWSSPTNNNIDFTSYYQQEIDILPDRLSIVGGGSWRYIENDTLAQTYLADSYPFGSTNTVLSLGVYRAEVVLQVVPKQVSIYAMQSTLANSNGSALGAGNVPLPPQQGLGKEVGVKTDIFDGKISSTTSVYQITLTNVAQFVGYNSAGQAIDALIGETIQKGWDTDVTFQPVTNLSIVATYQNGSVENQVGAPVANSYRGMWSVFGRYEMPKESSLHGLIFGGGASEIIGRLEGDSGYTLTPAQQSQLIGGKLIEAKSEVLANAFVSYIFAKHWMISLTVDNILNSNFPQGAQAAAFVDPAPPLTFGGKATLRF